jgi:hypothetical protein
VAGAAALLAAHEGLQRLLHGEPHRGAREPVRAECASPIQLKLSFQVGTAAGAFAFARVSQALRRSSQV